MYWSAFGLKINKKLNQKIIITMQIDFIEANDAEPFYNFRNRFSYNFKRSDH